MTLDYKNVEVRRNKMNKNYLISKCLRRIVNNDDFGEISAKNTKILNIFSINAQAMFTEQAISEIK